MLNSKWEKIIDQTIIGALFSKGVSQIRLSFFNGKYFSHWKIRMETFTKSYDVKVWKVIKLGDLPLVLTNKYKYEKKPKNDEALTDTIPTLKDYTNEQIKIIQIDSKAKNVLYNVISGEEYEKISCYETAKEMCDKLRVTYEGIEKAKQTLVNLLVYDYKLFKMKDADFIKEIFFFIWQNYWRTQGYRKNLSCSRSDYQDS